MDPILFPFPPYKQPGLLQPLVLAYLGDAVYEMYIRQYLISLPNHRSHHLHKQATKYVSAKAQAKALKAWIPILSEEELEIVKKGRNAKSGSTPKNTDVLEYRHSTAFECLIGYLFYKHQYERLESLLQLALNETQFQRQREYKEDTEWRNT
jgi:ribonuclease-3 family protein